jgi:hypothetical protein
VTIWPVGESDKPLPVVTVCEDVEELSGQSSSVGDQLAARPSIRISTTARRVRRLCEELRRLSTADQPRTWRLEPLKDDVQANLARDI